MKDTEQTLTLKTLTTPIIASLYQDAGKTKLMTVPNTASDTLAALAATQTFTNKTLTTPVIASIYIDAGKTKLMSFADVASDTICVIGAAQTLLLKTLTTPVIASIYQDAGKTKLMTLPDTASDTLTANAATQTLTNKTLTAPAITSPDLTFAASAHDYAGAAADWTLSAAEIKTMFLSTSNSSGATNIIAPTTANKVYILYNATASACTIKTAAGTGVEVATTKTAVVRCDGTNYVRVTADA
jgi:anti-sigma-K factor RskA